jgi:hypothetical protein
MNLGEERLQRAAVLRQLAPDQIERPSLLFPRPPTRAVADIVNDHFVMPDFVNDEIAPYRKSPEARLARGLADVGLFGDERSDLFDANDQTRGSFRLSCAM